MGVGSVRNVLGWFKRLGAIPKILVSVTAFFFVSFAILIIAAGVSLAFESDEEKAERAEQEEKRKNEREEEKAIKEEEKQAEEKAKEEKEAKENEEKKKK